MSVGSTSQWYVEVNYFSCGQYWSIQGVQFTTRHYVEIPKEQRRISEKGIPEWKINYHPQRLVCPFELYQNCKMKIDQSLAIYGSSNLFFFLPRSGSCKRQYIAGGVTHFLQWYSETNVFSAYLSTDCMYEFNLKFQQASKARAIPNGTSVHHYW